MIFQPSTCVCVGLDHPHRTPVLLHRQIDREAAAAAYLAGYLQISAVQADDIGSKRQPQAHALRKTPDTWATIEGLENLLALFRRDADAVVLHRDPYPALASPPAATRMHPPSGVYWMALATRFPITCAIRSASIQTAGKSPGRSHCHSRPLACAAACQVTRISGQPLAQIDLFSL